jgi:hypothetical protein
VKIEVTLIQEAFPVSIREALLKEQMNSGSFQIAQLLAVSEFSSQRIAAQFPASVVCLSPLSHCESLPRNGLQEMYNGLRFLGKDVTLLRYPGQGHGFEGAALKGFWERENAFFDKYLKPEQASN